MPFHFSHFADVALAEPGIFRLMEDLDAALSGEEQLCMLGGGNPGHVHEVHEYFRQAFLALGQDSRRFAIVAGQYDGPAGNTEFRRILGERLQSLYGWQVNENQILITQGSQNAFFLLLNLFSGPSPDGVHRRILFVQSPDYIGYENSGLHSGSMTAVPSIKQSLGSGFFRYSVDYERIRRELESGSIGALCLSRPSNPTGGMLEDSEMQKLSSMAEEFDIPLIVDGAYGEPFPGVVFGSGKPHFDRNTIFVLSLSKTGLPGIRTGIILAPDNVCRTLERIQAVEHLAPGGVGPALVQDGIETGSLIELCKAYLPAFYKTRQELAINILFNGLRVDEQIQIHRPDGAFFLWAIFPDLAITTNELYARLKQSGVLVVPGSYYYPGLSEEDRRAPSYEGDRAIRISYGQDLNVIREGLEILVRVVREASRIH